MLPLKGLRVLDFTTLLPGPLCTLVLSEAGADVIKIERPGTGEPGRKSYTDASAEPVDFAVLNKGKKSIALDLKSEAGRDAAISLAGRADILVEQFRPGVMSRLGLGYDAMSKLNPGLVYCSISGYGQTGPLAQKVGHDLNYIARTGMLGLAVEADGRPAFPQGHYADIGGGTYPAIVNILLALLGREKTGKGSHLDIAMAENTFFWMRRALSPVLQGTAPDRGKRMPSTGDSPRYGIYLASDGASLSVAPLEEPFWLRFCELIDLPEDQRRGRTDDVRAAIQARLATKTAAAWDALFADEEVCVELVKDVRDVVDDPHFAARGIFDRRLKLKSGNEIPALPLPIQKDFLSSDPTSYPAVGEHNAELDQIWR